MSHWQAGEWNSKKKEKTIQHISEVSGRLSDRICLRAPAHTFQHDSSENVRKHCDAFTLQKQQLSSSQKRRTKKPPRKLNVSVFDFLEGWFLPLITGSPVCRVCRIPRRWGDEEKWHGSPICKNGFKFLSTEIMTVACQWFDKCVKCAPVYSNSLPLLCHLNRCTGYLNLVESGPVFLKMKGCLDAPKNIIYIF